MEDFDPNNIYNSNPMLNYSNNIQKNEYSIDIVKPNKSI